MRGHGPPVPGALAKQRPASAEFRVECSVAERARGRERKGRWSRLRGDGTEGPKAIEDQRKAKAARGAEKETESETTRSRGGLRQQPARLVFWSETDPQLDIGIAAVNATAHNVVTQF